MKREAIREAKLIRIYERWIEREKLPFISADELVVEGVSIRQAVWLTKFIRIWELNCYGE